jgi:hypothetical protein
MGMSMETQHEYELREAEEQRREERIPDPIERGEARCEDWLFDSKVGDKHRCSCGRLFSLEDGETVSADPYAIPVCPTCFGEWWDSHGGGTKDKR